MTEWTLEEAQPRLKELLDRAETGDAVVIRNESGARILLRLDTTAADPVVHTPVEASKRVFGQWKGLVEVGPEFFEPLSDEELALFTDGPVYPVEDLGQTECEQKTEAK